MTGLRQLGAARSLADPRPDESEPVIDRIPVTLICIALFSLPAKCVTSALTSASEVTHSTICLSLSTICLSLSTICLSLCLATQLAVVPVDEHRSGCSRTRLAEQMKGLHGCKKEMG